MHQQVDNSDGIDSKQFVTAKGTLDSCFHSKARSAVLKTEDIIKQPQYIVQNCQQSQYTNNQARHSAVRPQIKGTPEKCVNKLRKKTKSISPFKLAKWCQHQQISQLKLANQDLKNEMEDQTNKTKQTLNSFLNLQVRSQISTSSVKIEAQNKINQRTGDQQTTQIQNRQQDFNQSNHQNFEFNQRLSQPVQSAQDQKYIITLTNHQSNKSQRNWESPKLFAKQIRNLSNETGCNRQMKNISIPIQHQNNFDAIGNQDQLGTETINKSVYTILNQSEVAKCPIQKEQQCRGRSLGSQEVTDRRHYDQYPQKIFGEHVESFISANEQQVDLQPNEIYKTPRNSTQDFFTFKQRRICSNDSDYDDQDNQQHATSRCIIDSIVKTKIPITKQEFSVSPIKSQKTQNHNIQSNNQTQTQVQNSYLNGDFDCVKIDQNQDNKPLNVDKTRKRKDILSQILNNGTFRNRRQNDVLPKQKNKYLNQPTTHKIVNQTQTTKHTIGNPLSEKLQLQVKQPVQKKNQVIEKKRIIPEQTNLQMHDQNKYQPNQFQMNDGSVKQKLQQIKNQFSIQNMKDQPISNVQTDQKLSKIQENKHQTIQNQKSQSQCFNEERTSIKSKLPIWDRQHNKNKVIYKQRQSVVQFEALKQMEAQAKQNQRSRSLISNKNLTKTKNYQDRGVKSNQTPINFQKQTYNPVQNSHLRQQADSQKLYKILSKQPNNSILNITSQPKHRIFKTFQQTPKCVTFEQNKKFNAKSPIQKRNTSVVDMSKVQFKIEQNAVENLQTANQSKQSEDKQLVNSDNIKQTGAQHIQPKNQYENTSYSSQNIQNKTQEIPQISILTHKSDGFDEMNGKLPIPDRIHHEFNEQENTHCQTSNSNLDQQPSEVLGIQQITSDSNIATQQPVQLNDIHHNKVVNQLFPNQKSQSLSNKNTSCSLSQPQTPVEVVSNSKLKIDNSVRQSITHQLNTNCNNINSQNVKELSIYDILKPVQTSKTICSTTKITSYQSRSNANNKSNYDLANLKLPSSTPIAQGTKPLNQKLQANYYDAYRNDQQKNTQISNLNNFYSKDVAKQYMQKKYNSNQNKQCNRIANKKDNSCARNQKDWTQLDVSKLLQLKKDNSETIKRTPTNSNQISQTFNRKQAFQQIKSHNSLGRVSLKHLCPPNQNYDGITKQRRDLINRKQSYSNFSCKSSNNSTSYKLIYQQKFKKLKEPKILNTITPDLDNSLSTNNIDYLSQTRASQIRNRRFLNSQLQNNKVKSHLSLQKVDNQNQKKDTGNNKGESPSKQIHLKNSDSGHSDIISVNIPQENIQIEQNLLQQRSFDNRKLTNNLVINSQQSIQQTNLQSDIIQDQPIKLDSNEAVIAAPQTNELDIPLIQPINNQLEETVINLEGELADQQIIDHETQFSNQLHGFCEEIQQPIQSSCTKNEQSELLSPTPELNLPTMSVEKPNKQEYCSTSNPLQNTYSQQQQAQQTKKRRPKSDRRYGSGCKYQSNQIVNDYQDVNDPLILSSPKFIQQNPPHKVTLTQDIQTFFNNDAKTDSAKRSHQNVIRNYNNNYDFQIDEDNQFIIQKTDPINTVSNKNITLRNIKPFDTKVNQLAQKIETVKERVASLRQSIESKPKTIDKLSPVSKKHQVLDSNRVLSQNDYNQKENELMMDSNDQFDSYMSFINDNPQNNRRKRRQRTSKNLSKSSTIICKDIDTQIKSNYDQVKQLQDITNQDQKFIQDRDQPLSIKKTMSNQCSSPQVKEPNQDQAGEEMVNQELQDQLVVDKQTKQNPDICQSNLADLDNLDKDQLKLVICNLLQKLNQ